MKIHYLALGAALSVTTAANAKHHGVSPHYGESGSGVQVNEVEVDRMPTSKKDEVTAKPMLGPEYKDIAVFSNFRKKLIEDGWVPVPDPDCHDTVLGGDYDEYCSEYPDSISCRLCALVPEIWRSTSDGYNLMRYTKGGVPLGVTVYGDVNDLDDPGRHGLVPIGWAYSEGINVFLLD